MRRLLALLMLSLFVVYATPRELWHALSDHEDTVHHQLKGVYVEPQHHHCDVLQFEQHLPLEFVWDSFQSKSSTHEFFLPYLFSYTSVPHLLVAIGNQSLRAPPTAYSA